MNRTSVLALAFLPLIAFVADRTPSDSTTAPTTTVPSAPPLSMAVPDGWVQITDDTGTLAVAVPGEWSDADTAVITHEDGARRPHIVAAPNIDSHYLAPFTEPGLVMGASPFNADTQSAIDTVGPTMAKFCPAQSTTPFSSPMLTGTHLAMGGCGGGTAEHHVVLANPADQSVSVFADVTISGPQDLPILDNILQSITVVPGATLPESVPTTAPPAPFPPPSGQVPAGWTSLVDDTQTVQIAVPPAWTEIATEPVGNEPNLVASPDRFPYMSDKAPGVTVGTYEYVEFTEDFAPLWHYGDLCAQKVVQPLTVGTYTGHIATHSECPEGLTVYHAVVNSPTNTTHTLFATIHLMGAPDDAATLDGLLSTVSFTS